jgi:hypothetical protein
LTKERKEDETAEEEFKRYKNARNLPPTQYI